MLYKHSDITAVETPQHNAASFPSMGVEVLAFKDVVG